AVSARSSVVPASCGGPAALAEHLVHILHTGMDGKYGCDGEETRFFAAPYRWCIVVEALQAEHKSDPDAGRHPRSDEWAVQYGRDIPGDTIAEQFRHVSAWWERGQRDDLARVAALWGTSVPCAVETAVGVGRDHDDWKERLNEAVVPLRNLGGFLESYVVVAAPAEADG
ncbi:hypothetical protein ACFQ07_07940, partial [Actinomadura adrarensis]